MINYSFCISFNSASTTTQRRITNIFTGVNSSGQNPIDFYFSKLSNGNYYGIHSWTNINRQIYSQLRPQVLHNLYYIICDALVPEKKFSEFYSAIAQYSTIYKSSTDVRDELKHPIREFAKAIQISSEINILNPYLKNTARFNRCGTIDFSTNKGEILHDLVLFLNESIKYNEKGSPISFRILPIKLLETLIKNYQFLPNRGNFKNGYNFIDLQEFDNIVDIKGSYLVENKTAMAIECKYDELLYATILNSIFPSFRIRNTICHYLDSFWNPEDFVIQPEHFQVLTLYKTILHLPTIDLQNEYASKLISPFINNNVINLENSGFSPSLQGVLQEMVFISNILTPLMTIDLLNGIQLYLKKPSSAALDSQDILIDTKEMLEEYFDYNKKLTVLNAPDNIPTFANLDKRLTGIQPLTTGGKISRRQLNESKNICECEILYKLLSLNITPNRINPSRYLDNPSSYVEIVVDDYCKNFFAQLISLQK